MNFRNVFTIRKGSFIQQILFEGLLCAKQSKLDLEWFWRRLLRVPWTARRSDQSILKEINTEYSFGGTDAKAETPILGPPDVKN